MSGQISDDEGRGAMKVERVCKVKSLYIEIDGENYQRYSSENWRVLIGDSWESLYFCDQHELAYQEWLNEHCAK